MTNVEDVASAANDLAYHSNMNAVPGADVLLPYCCREVMMRITLLAAGFVIGKLSFVVTLWFVVTLASS